MTTGDGGVSWRAPDGDLPRGLSDLLDIRAVAHRNETVLVGGFPGATLAAAKMAERAGQC
ncbi:MAG UNVERIFIED_CONTAM: hypothetical protein LVR18_18595 [Planctomycetaceae bacterium]